MVVTAGTHQADAHEGGSRRVHRICESFVTQLGTVQVRFLNLRTERIHRRSDSGFEVFQLFIRDIIEASQIQIVRPKFVTCDLFLHKAVVGFVLVEGLDDVVTVTPALG